MVKNANDNAITDKHTFRGLSSIPSMLVNCFKYVACLFSVNVFK